MAFRLKWPVVLAGSLLLPCATALAFTGDYDELGLVVVRRQVEGHCYRQPALSTFSDKESAFEPSLPFFIYL